MYGCQVHGSNLLGEDREGVGSPGTDVSGELIMITTTVMLRRFKGEGTKFDLHCTAVNIYFSSEDILGKL